MTYFMRSRRDGSDEGSHYMVSMRDKKNHSCIIIKYTLLSKALGITAYDSVEKWVKLSQNYLWLLPLSGPLNSLVQKDIQGSTCIYSSCTNDFSLSLFGSHHWAVSVIHILYKCTEKILSICKYHIIIYL